MACVLEIKVFPQAGRTTLSIEPSGRIIAHLKSPPVDGKANKELIKLLAKMLSISPMDLTIVFGLTSRIKRVKITGPLTSEQVMSKLGFAVQTTFIQ
ncbi:DUF167 domain-containing protein [Candidatus Dependentiae bacterium]|nr:DUF167 domain-containing protein [Candidatus Dependentiae bacterium]